MKELYEKLWQAACFGGVNALYRAAKGRILKMIQDLCSGVYLHTLYKLVIRKFLTNQVIL